jgi:hypothetical protein
VRWNGKRRKSSTYGLGEKARSHLLFCLGSGTGIGNVHAVVGINVNGEAPRELDPIFGKYSRPPLAEAPGCDLADEVRDVRFQKSATLSFEAKGRGDRDVGRRGFCVFVFFGGANRRHNNKVL